MKTPIFSIEKCVMTLFFSLIVFQAHATNYYVAVNGSNSNAGSLQNPFATIEYAVNSKMNPGDVLFVRGGIYKFNTYLSKSGTPSAMITIKNYPGELPEINGWNNGIMNTGNGFGNGSGANLSHIRIEGFHVTGFYRGIGINWCTPCNTELSRYDQTRNNGYLQGTNIQIAYNVVDGCGQNGISVFFSSNVVIERNLVSRTGFEVASGSWSSGINLLGASGYNRIDSNVSFHHVDVSGNNTDGNGIIVDLSYDGINNNANTQVTNNISFNNGGSGIQITRSSKVTVLNNSTYNNVQTLPSFWGEFTISSTPAYRTNGNQIVNTILFPKSGGKSIGIDGNFPNQISVDANNLKGGVIQYKNAGIRDFSLKTAQSTAINKGNSGYSFLTNDNGYILTNIVTAGASPGSFSWYTHYPNIGYIKSRGGLGGCFVAHPRRQLSITDIGAIESAVPSTAKLSNDNISKTVSSDKSNFTIYPNPFKNEFNFKSNVKIQSSNISLHNILGQSEQFKIESINDNNYRINTTNLASGVYFFKINTTDESKTLKIIKE
jgi:Secretion system C-terminal sorting domain